MVTLSAYAIILGPASTAGLGRFRQDPPFWQLTRLASLAVQSLNEDFDKGESYFFK